jgi:hypothetical protein
MLFPGMEGKILDRHAHQLRQRVHAELRLQLPASIGDGLVAHVQVGRDLRIWLSLGEQRQNLQLAHGDGTERVGGLAAPP